MLGIATLEIYSCNESHSGKYTCRASNKLGEDETVCKLIVEREFLLPKLCLVIKSFGIFRKGKSEALITEYAHKVGLFKMTL